MANVVFVGDEPSKTNIDVDVAFVGAKCFQRLTEWINYLGPDYYICLNSHTIRDISKIGILELNGFKIVALGAKASKRLEDNGITHFKLSHPSGLNRKINDQKAIEHELDTCLVWLQDHPVSGAV